MNNEFYIDIRIVDRERFNSIKSKFYDCLAANVLDTNYFELHFVDGENVDSIIPFYIDSNNIRRAFCVCGGYILSYKIINFSRKRTINHPSELRSIISKYRQNLEEIKQIKETNYKMVSRYLKQGVK